MNSDAQPKRLTLRVRQILLSLSILVSSSASCVSAANIDPELERKAEEQQRKPIHMHLKNGLDVSNVLPTNFPAPIYKNNVTKSAFISSNKGIPTAEATISTTDSPKSVYDWERNQLSSAGWQVVIPSDKMNDLLAKAHAKAKSKSEIYMFSAAKDQQILRVTCYSGAKKIGATLNLLWSSKHAPVKS